jgi:uncharacterized protein
MGQPVVHFEVIGRDAAGLRNFYGELFNWEFDTSGPVPALVSDEGNYGYIERTSASSGAGVPGGVGGGASRKPHTLFYVGVPDVAAAFDQSELLGGTRVWGPVTSPNGHLVVGQFTDPEGNLIGVANVV